MSPYRTKPRFLVHWSSGDIRGRFACEDGTGPGTTVPSKVTCSACLPHAAAALRRALSIVWAFS